MCHGNGVCHIVRGHLGVGRLFRGEWIMEGWVCHQWVGRVCHLNGVCHVGRSLSWRSGVGHGGVG